MARGWIMSGDICVAIFDGTAVVPTLPSLAPLCFRKGGDLNWWLDTRVVDRHRTNSRILKRILRLSDTSDRNTVMHVHAATITDNYWVKGEDEADLTWDAVRFSHDYFADISLRGDFDSFSKVFSDEQLRAPTPELTNTGSFEKCWRLEDGTWHLHKRGDDVALFSEEFVYKLGKSLGFSMAEYRQRDGYVDSPDFTNGVVNFEPAANLVYEEEDYAINYDKLRDLKPGLELEYLDILFMDALVFNVDRHTQNYGILRDTCTGEVLSMAPNFDNNLALISTGYATDINVVANPLTSLFTEVVKEKGVSYRIPNLCKDDLRLLALSCTKPGQVIRRDYVVDFVWRNYQYLCKGLGQ